MANNRVAYGLAKEYGIDTTGKSPKEVWEALKGKGINQDNYAQYQNRQNKGYSQKPRTKASETYRLSYSGEEIPKKDVEFAVIKTINNGRWNINDAGGLDMAIKDATGTLLDTYEDMSYEEAYDYASEIAERHVEEKKNKPAPKATKKMIDAILANKEAEKAANQMLKSGKLSFNEVAVLTYNYYIKGKNKG